MQSLELSLLICIKTIHFVVCKVWQRKEALKARFTSHQKGTSGLSNMAGEHFLEMEFTCNCAGTPNRASAECAHITIFWLIPLHSGHCPNLLSLRIKHREHLPLKFTLIDNVQYSAMDLLAQNKWETNGAMLIDGLLYFPLAITSAPKHCRTYAWKSYAIRYCKSSWVSK